MVFTAMVARAYSALRIVALYEADYVSSLKG